MSYAHTIALARELMADGHFDAVEQIVGPLLGHDDVDQSEEASLRCMLAGAQLLSGADFAKAEALLTGYLVPGMRARLSESALTEVNIWLGWTLAIGSASDVKRRKGLSILAEAVENASRRSDVSMLGWALAGYSQALEEHGALDLARTHAGKLSIISEALALEGLKPIVSRLADTTVDESLASMELRSTVSDSLLCELNQLRFAAAAGLPILILGEHGVGKKALARALAMATAPSCIEISAAESDMVKQSSALTGDGGDGGNPVALLVYDVDRLEREHQERLLEALTTFGSSYPNRMRLLVSTATKDPLRLGDDRSISADLLLKLSPVRIKIPPLRQRKEDVEVIVRSRLSQRSPGMATAVITNRALEALRRYEWPGNDRQLSEVVDVLRRSLAVDPSPVIDLGHLPESIVSADRRPSTLNRWIDEEFSRDRDLEQVLSQAEKILIESTLAKTRGQVSAAAEVLGLTRQGLYKKMKRLDVDPARFHEDEEQSQRTQEYITTYEGIHG